MKNITIINASAGSGKTYSLTGKVLEEIERGGTPEGIMATTFTNKAAAELRERIRVKLLEGGRSEEALRIYDSFINTVNSICSRLLKEYALEAGLSPAIETLPEDDGSRLFKIAVESMISSYADELEPVAFRLDMLGSKSRYSKGTDWRDLVKEIVDIARSNRMSRSVLEESCRSSVDSLLEFFGGPDSDDMDERMETELKKCINQITHLDSTIKKTGTVLKTLKDCRRKLDRGDLTWGDWVQLQGLDPEKKAQDIVAELKDLGFRVYRHPRLQQDVRTLIEGVFHCAIDAIEGYEAYKREHGIMDFIDQETKVLELAVGNQAFKDSMRDRISLLMVDEFQDTNPVQLALFLALHELAGRSVWVGDPKQAIYGFRGTDPQLMNEVVKLLKSDEILDCSWRSKENLIRFTNGIFSQVFHQMGRDKVELKVPEERKEQAAGGDVEIWELENSGSKSKEHASIANGVLDLLTRKTEIQPGDIAILCRTNDNCSQMAAALEAAGIRASVGQGSLADTWECQLALAALKYINNRQDSLALAELVHLNPNHSSHQGWVRDLMKNPKEALERWRNDPVVKILDEARLLKDRLTPKEALEEAISRTGLVRLAKSRNYPELALGNLDVLRGLCDTYVEQCKSMGGAATIEGYLASLKDAEMKQAKGSGSGTVNVLTYHKCKGLEWPWVILTDLDKDNSRDVFNITVMAATEFNPEDPLANRWVHYWPWPFGGKTHKDLREAAKKLPISESIAANSLEEEQRLLYVGMTRAKDGLVLAARRSKEGVNTAWLGKLVGIDKLPVFNPETEMGPQTLQAGGEEVSATIFGYVPDLPEEVWGFSSPEEFLPILPEVDVVHSPARVSPSKLAEEGFDSSTVRTEVVERFPSGIPIKGNAEMDLLGNAVHAYLGTDCTTLLPEERILRAEDILKRWGVSGLIEAEALVEAGSRLQAYLEVSYPGATVRSEWPITLRNSKGQLFQGWIDLLLETAEGFVILDHKSFPGPEAKERVRKHAPQLRLYREAVEKATGRKVVDLLIHLPVSGMIIRVE